MKSRVFIVQQPKPKADGWVPDFEPATEFGTLHFIFDAGDRPYSDANGARRKALIKLRDFDPEVDYILDPRFGDPAASWEVLKLLVALKKEPRMLYWSRGRGENGEMTNERGYYFEYAPPSIFEFLKQQQSDSYEENKKDKSKTNQENTSPA